MLDMHVHILPGLDDGSASMGDTLKMALIAMESGITDIIATSHGNCYDHNINDYWNTFFNVKKEFARNGISLNLYPGMEILVDDTVSAKLSKGELLPLNESRNILIEFPFEADLDTVYKRIQELQDGMWRVILAHPERYSFFQKNPSCIEELVDMGCAMQVNYDSFRGGFGKEEMHLAWAMLKARLIHCIGTDGHSSDWRKPSMKGLKQMLKTEVSSQYYELLIYENSNILIRGEELYMMTPKKLFY